MSTSNPYPERAIASFVLVGAMGVALLFIGSPDRDRGANSGIIAQDQPDRPTGQAPRSTTPTPTLAPSPNPDSTPVSRFTPQVNAPSYTAVFSEAASRHQAETPATPTSAAPTPTQAPSSPEPGPTPDGDQGSLLDVELDVEVHPCATSLLLLNELLCR